MGAQNFIFAIKFPQKCGFSASNVAFLKANFWTKRKFFDKLKFRVRDCPTCSPCHDANVHANSSARSLHGMFYDKIFKNF